MNAPLQLARRWEGAYELVLPSIITVWYVSSFHLVIGINQVQPGFYWSPIFTMIDKLTSLFTLVMFSWKQQREMYWCSWNINHLLTCFGKHVYMLTWLHQFLDCTHSSKYFSSMFIFNGKSTFAPFMDLLLLNPRPPQAFSLTRPPKGGCCNPLTRFSILNVLYPYVCYQCIVTCPPNLIYQIKND